MEEFDSISSKGMAEPPEGVISGESVPVENEAENINESEIQEIVGLLKSRGPPYTEMSESELRDKAGEIIHETGGFIE